MNKKTIVFVMVALLVGICVPMPGNNPGFIPIVSAGGDCPTTEAELEADLTDVNDVYTNNDFADNSANWNTAFGWGNHALEGYLKNPVSYIDYLEIATPSIPAANTLRLFVEDFHGFSFYKFLDNTSMKRALVRDSVILVKNVRGTTILANRIVYATGSENDVPTVDYAKADNIDTMPSIGVTIEEITNSSYGRVMQVGLLEDIDTSTLNPGDVLYVSDVVAGLPRVTLPPTPSLIQEIGTVLVSDAVNGSIQIVARSIDGNEYGTINDFTIVKNCTASAFFGDGGNLTNITADGDGFAGDVGHPHDQDLNVSDSPRHLSMYIDDYLEHSGDSNTVIEFLTDAFRFTTGGNIGLHQLSSGNVDINKDLVIDQKIVSDDDATDYYQSAGAHTLFTNGNNIARFGAGAVIFNEYSGDENFKIESNNQVYAFWVDGGSDFISMFSNTHSVGKEVDVNGDHEATSYNPTSDSRVKDIRYVLDELPDNYVLRLCRNIDFVVFKWNNEKTQYWNGTDYIYFDVNNEGFGVSCIAQELYYNILNNFTGNPTLNEIVANALVSVGNETLLWTINKDNLASVYQQGWKILDRQIQENIEHTKHLESWAESLNDLLPSAYDFEPIPWD